MCTQKTILMKCANAVLFFDKIMHNLIIASKDKIFLDLLDLANGYNLIVWEIIKCITMYDATQADTKRMMMNGQVNNAATKTDWRSIFIRFQTRTYLAWYSQSAHSINAVDFYSLDNCNEMVKSHKSFVCLCGDLFAISWPNTYGTHRSFAFNK